MLTAYLCQNGLQSVQATNQRNVTYTYFIQATKHGKEKIILVNLIIQGDKLRCRWWWIS